MISVSMKSNLTPCRYCHQPAECGWLVMDDVWSSYYVGCSNDLCDAMISMEVVSAGKSFRGLVETVIQQAWNKVNA